MFNMAIVSIKKISAFMAFTALLASGSVQANLNFLSNTGLGATSGWNATAQTFTSTTDQVMLGYSFIGANSAQSSFTFRLYDWTTAGDHTALFSSVQSWNAGLNSINGINVSLLAGHIYAAEVNYGAPTPGGVLFGGDVYSGGNGFWSGSGGGNQASYSNFTTLDTAFGVTFGTAVPEPATYSLLLAGLGLIGFSARRKKNNV